MRNLKYAVVDHSGLLQKDVPLVRHIGDAGEIRQNKQWFESVAGVDKPARAVLFDTTDQIWRITQ